MAPRLFAQATRCSPGTLTAPRHDLWLQLLASGQQEHNRAPRMVCRAPPECLGRPQITIGKLDSPLSCPFYLFGDILTTRIECRNVLVLSYSYVTLLEGLSRGRYVFLFTEVAIELTIA